MHIFTHERAEKYAIKIHATRRRERERGEGGKREVDININAGKSNELAKGNNARRTKRNKRRVKESKIRPLVTLVGVVRRGRERAGWWLNGGGTVCGKNFY